LAEPLHITRVDNLEAILALRERWNALAAQNATDSVFQTWEWVVSWLKVWQDTGKLWVLVAEEDGRLVGIAPLILRQRRVLGRRRRVLEFLGADLFRVCDFIVERARPDVTFALLDWLNQRRNQWDLLLLANLPESSPTLPALAERAAAVGQRAETRDLDYEPTIALDDWKTDETVVNSRKTRQHFNRLNRAGQADFVIFQDEESVLRYLHEFARQHIARWANTATPSDFNIPAFYEFHRQLVLTFAPTGWLKMGALMLDGAPIALNLFFEYRNKLFLFECAYDLERAALSPGFLSHVQMVRYGMAQGVAKISFGRGHEPYKFDFCNSTPMHRELRLWARRASYTVDHLVERGWGALGRVPAVKRALERRVARNRSNAKTGLRG